MNPRMSTADAENTFKSGDLFARFVLDDASKTTSALIGMLPDNSRTTFPETPLFNQAVFTFEKLGRAFEKTEQRQQMFTVSTNINVHVNRAELEAIARGVLSSVDERNNLAERVVALFILFSDLLKRVTLLGTGRVGQLFLECQESITEVMDPVVLAHGGWEQVIKSAAVGDGFWDASVKIYAGARYFLSCFLEN